MSSLGWKVGHMELYVGRGRELGGTWDCWLFCWSSGQRKAFTSSTFVLLCSEFSLALLGSFRIQRSECGFGSVPAPISSPRDVHYRFSRAFSCCSAFAASHSLGAPVRETARFQPGWLPNSLEAERVKAPSQLVNISSPLRHITG